MRRKWVTLAAGASAVLCVAACVLWVRSHYGGDTWYKPTFRGPGDVFWSSNGTLAIERWDDLGRWPRRSTGPWEHHRSAPIGAYSVFMQDVRWWNRLGFSAGAQPNPSSEQRLVRWATAPHWAIAALTALLPATSLVRATARRRRAIVGRCSHCGYDLRATPDCCPECGAVPGKGAAA